MADSTPLLIHTHARYMCGMSHRAFGLLADTALAWPVANLAIYLPLSIPWGYTVNRIGWCNGTLSGTPSIAVGIFDGSTNTLYQGTTTQAGNGAIQYHTLSSPLVLAAGIYTVGISIANATTQIRGTTVTAAQGRQLGLLQQASANPLPSVSATYAAFAQTIEPTLVVTRTTSGYT